MTEALARPVAADPTDRAGVWVLTATILGSAMAFIDGTVVNVALPALQVDLKGTTAGVQWVVESYALFLSSLLLIGGALGDRLGRRLVYLSGIVLFTAASIACGFAPNLPVLVAARAIQGAGAALLVPGGLAIISAYFPPERRGRAIGTWSGFSAITTAFGPVLGGWLIQAISWRAIFFLNVPLAIGVLLIATRWIPESRDEEAEGRLDWGGAALVTVGLGGIVLGLIDASGLASPVAVYLPLAVGIVALAAFTVVEERISHPMVQLGLFHNRTFLGANILTLLLYGALGSAFFFIPFDLISVHRYTATEAGAALLPFPVILFLFSRWTGGLVDRVGPRLPLIIGPGVAGCGFALFALPGVGGSYWTTFFPAMLALAAGMTITVAPLTTTVMNSVSAQRAGSASGINNAASRVAGLLALALLGIVVVQVFAHEFDNRLNHLALSPAARQALRTQRDKTVGIAIPSTVQGSTRATVRGAIDRSYLAGFRVAMLLCGLLGIASAVAAALTVPAGRPGM